MTSRVQFYEQRARVRTHIDAALEAAAGALVYATDEDLIAFGVILDALGKARKYCSE